MSEDIVERLIRNPGEIFNFQAEAERVVDQDTNINTFNTLLKSLLDPIANKYSILDEIYIDGLDATQVYGQAKIVLDGVGQQLLGSDIPELKEKYGSVEEEEDEDEDGVDEDEDDEENLEVEGEYDDEEDEEDTHTLIGGVESDEDEEEEDEEADQEEQVSDAETNVASEPEIEEEEFDINNHKKDSFGLNDGFFDIDEYNKQVLALEESANNQEDDGNDDEEIDYFGNLSGDDEDEDEEVDYYDDFYDKPGSNAVIKQNKHKRENADNEEEEGEFEGEFDEAEYDNAMGTAMLDLFEDEEAEEEQKSKSTENLSSYQKQQQKLQEEIAKLEAELVADKKWTMKGEIAAKDRPQDSLIDDSESSNLKFDRTSKAVPIITDEVTETIEDLIRRRIKNEEFNDLPKRLISDVSKYYQSKRDKYELSEQKSSKSLSELYEDEYSKSTNESGENTIDSKISDEVQKQHDEITELFTKVTHSLDALSSAHFIPKPHQFKTIEIKVTDAVNMEDAQPLNVSSESQLAPQEIYKIGDAKQKGDDKVLLKSGLSYSKDELSTDEKQRLRRAGKRKRSKEFNKRKERIEAKETAAAANVKDSGKPNKRQKVSTVVDTLSKAKNVTVIDKKGQLRDVKGNLKNNGGVQDSNSFKL